MNCDPNALMAASKCFRCIPQSMTKSVWVYLLCQWANSVGAVVILDDGSGGFWRLVVDTLGNLGAESDPGPATPDVILDDGGGGFWKLVVTPGGLRGAESSVGPSTPAPVLSDGSGGSWTLVVDTSGNVGTV